MRVICVYVQDTESNKAKLEEISFLFPCFVFLQKVKGDEENVEVMIKCRQEDARAIEERLSDIV